MPRNKCSWPANPAFLAVRCSRPQKAAPLRSSGKRGFRLRITCFWASPYEPDATLRCGEALAGDGVDVPDPLLVVEVLSPSTKHIDLTVKLVDYFKLPTLQHYLIFVAGHAQLIHHRRMAEDGMIYTRMINAGPLHLDPPGITITMEEIFLPPPGRRNE